MKLEHITKHIWHCNQLGGGCSADFIELKDGTVICITDDCIGLYRSMEHFEEGTEKACVGTIQRPEDSSGNIK